MLKDELLKVYSKTEIQAFWLGGSIISEAICLGLLLRGDLPIEWYTFPVLILNALAIILLIRSLFKKDKEFEALLEEVKEE